jgi:hypothetical protein
MRRALLITAFALLCLAPSAQAAVTELGADANPNGVKASCPENCTALGRVSGYMGRLGKGTNPFQVPRAGKIVAFTVSLGKPDANQVTYFTGLYGGPPQVRLSIVRRGKTRKTRLNHRLLRQSDPVRVDHYFGSSPSFVLDKPLAVAKGNIVALTVPTWAPVFGPSLPKDNWWRSSRAKGKCSDVSQQAAQRTPGAIRVYGCTYFRARLMYTATYVPNPRTTDGTKP